jgi:hypothetical protein
MRSLEELSDSLSADRGWRLKEISSVVKLAHSAKSPVEAAFYCRGGAALFYAHWEGYAKRAAQAYLMYIAYQRPALNEMADFLLVKVVQEKLPKSSERQAALRLARLFLDNPTQKPKLSFKNAVDTESNLSSKVLVKILDQIGVPRTNFETRLNAIDAKLLAVRNPIAHGAKGEVEVTDLSEAGELVIALCGLLKDEIENAALRKSYLV